MSEQYKTTIGEYGTREVYDADGNKDFIPFADDPESPGPGWVMCGATGSNGVIMWFWERTTFVIEDEKSK